MTDDRPREVASRPHWDAVDAGRRQRRVRTSSAALRQQSPDRALVDVHCRRSAVLRVVQSEPLNAVLEARPGVTHIVDLTAAAVVLVDCHRCQQTHRLATAALAELARTATPGHPIVVPASRVSA